MSRYWIMGLSLCSNLTWSADYPLEFADFFEERHDSIELSIAGEVSSQRVDGLVTYETFRLNDKADNIARLSEYLKKQKLTNKAIDNVVSRLLAGVEANPGCKGALSLCIPSNIPNEAEFVFDFDAQRLRVFVESSMLRRQSYDEYYSSERTSNALINWTDLYVYTNSDGSGNLNWSNTTTLGLPMGFLSVETQYQQPDNELKLYQALYDVEKEDRRAIVGYQGQQATTFNSTDFLYSGANFAGVGASIGRSQHLLKGQERAQKRIYFFAPQTSQLEVYQGERLLLNKVVPQGQQSIGYDELPSGVYNLTLVLKQGSQEILNEQRIVVNTAQFTLPVSRWDYRVDAGFLKDLASDDARLEEISSSDRSYGRGALAYRPSETWLLASSMTSNVDDTLLNVGGYWAFNGGLSAQYNIGAFTSGSQSHYGQAVLGPLSASYRYINASETSSPLVNLLYGHHITRDWGLGVSGLVLGGIGYLNYNNYQTESARPLDSSAQQFRSESDNVSLSWSRDAFGGRLSLNTTYSMYQGQQQDAWNTTLAWTQSFGEHFSARTEFNTDKAGLAYNRNSATYQNSGDYGYVSSTVGIKRGRESDADISASLNGHRKTFGYSAYAYVSQEGQRSLSGNLSSTQILSSQGGEFTHEKARAFVSLHPNLTEPEPTSVEMSYNLLKDGELWYRDKTSLEQPTLIKLDDYTDVAFELDADTNNIDIVNHQYQQFVMPGYYYQLTSDIIPLASQVFLLNDMFGNPISSARCLGEGCKNVEILSDDGVVRVNYRKGRPFKLVSQKRLCVYDPNLIGETYIQTYCLPGLEDIDNNIVWKDEPNLIAPYEKEKALLYIGKYESTAESARILKRLQEVGLTSKAIRVGDSMYVYVRYLKQYTAMQRELLQSLDAYVILDSIHVDQLFSVR